jgi:hypothetical protein
MDARVKPAHDTLASAAFGPYFASACFKSWTVSAD